MLGSDLGHGFLELATAVISQVVAKRAGEAGPGEALLVVLGLLDPLDRRLYAGLDNVLGFVLILASAFFNSAFLSGSGME